MAISIVGVAGRLQLKCAAGVRPTKSVVRQALCDMLRPQLAGRWFIDLFAGSGAVGIAALVEGAVGCSFVEQDSRVFRTLRANVSLLQHNFAERHGCAARVELYRQSVSDFLRSYATAQPVLVWADPPWGESSWRRTLLAQLRVGCGSYLCIETQSHTGEIRAASSGWVVQKRRSYGNTMLEILYKE